MKLSELETIIDKHKKSGEIDGNSTVLVSWYANSEWGEIKAEVEKAVAKERKLILEVE